MDVVGGECRGVGTLVQEEESSKSGWVKLGCVVEEDSKSGWVRGGKQEWRG